MSVLDCRGMPCPQPVVRCRDWLKEGKHAGEMLEVLVDNSAAVENVGNFLRGRGLNVDTRNEGASLWRLSCAVPADGLNDGGSGDAAPAACSVSCGQAERGARTLVFIPSETLGSGDDELGAKLMVNFLGSLPELGEDLWRIVLVNGGVKLTAGGPALEKLKALAEAGCSILVCGTCLDHFGLLDKKQVGDTTNMLDIITSMQLADKIVRV
ncbi:MAG TPA: sulfurtransferase-like selenium metabolism protein YedF [Candidatus Mailhella merdavium]|nr:sulfurtransferase-like selenium metabolism protein YedF [Candidatus Mailhella merdavium]